MHRFSRWSFLSAARRPSSDRVWRNALSIPTTSALIDLSPILDFYPRLSRRSSMPDSPSTSSVIVYYLSSSQPTDRSIRPKPPFSVYWMTWSASSTKATSFCGYVSSPTAVERGEHQTNSESCSAKTACGFSANFNYACAYQDNGTNSFQAFLYPAFLSPPQSLSFCNQFAFRPTGFPEAEIISLIHIVTKMLLSNRYVVVISLDFRKAFDTVRYAIPW